jgi:hypothetical protein
MLALAWRGDSAAFDAIYVDVGGISGTDGLLEGISLVRSKSCSLLIQCCFAVCCGEPLTLGQSVRPEVGTFRARQWRLQPDENWTCGAFVTICLQFVYNLERVPDVERDQIRICFFTGCYCLGASEGTMGEGAGEACLLKLACKRRARGMKSKCTHEDAG